MWIELMSWWCRLFGYANCGQLSTFEAIVLAAVALFAVTLAAGLVAGVFAAIGQKLEH
jgi:hypothetical protein